MTYIAGNFSKNESSTKPKNRFYKRRWFKVIMIIVVLLLIGAGIFMWKTGSILNKVTEGGLFESLVHNIPGVKDQLKGEEEGRINLLLLGMRGENMPGGGNLADTIIMASINVTDKKVSMISIPRDLYVNVPGTGDKQKINAVHFYGEQKEKGKGLEDMKTAVTEVTGQPIHYATSIDFAGFKQLIDAIGGVDITLDKPFEEAMQFNEAHVCDSFFTIPTGEYQHKYDNVYYPGTKIVKRKRIVKSYPLCNAPKESLECGGDFKLPAGKQTLTGEQSLCYARSRATSSDFERAKRQQLIIKLVKDKMLSIGTLSDFSKVNGMLNALGNNVKTDMAIWEIQALYNLYKEMPEAQIYQRVLENSEEGLLYHPEPQDARGYILLPRGDNYDKIHQVARDIFTLAPQSDINPK